MMSKKEAEVVPGICVSVGNFSIFSQPAFGDAEGAVASRYEVEQNTKKHKTLRCALYITMAPIRTNVEAGGEEARDHASKV